MMTHFILKKLSHLRLSSDTADEVATSPCTVRLRGTMRLFARGTRLDESPAALLYQRYAPAIFAYLRLHLAVWEDAEDVLLEVFLAALEQNRLEAVPEEER